MAVVVMLGTAGCGAVATDDGRAAAGAAMICTHGTYAWSGIRHVERLTGLPDRITYADGGYQGVIEPVSDTVYRPTVTQAPEGVGPARVIKALGAHLKTDEPLAGPSETAGGEETDLFNEIGGSRQPYYTWESINLVEADFTYTCGLNPPVHGHVHTWDTFGGGFLPCSEPSEGAPAKVAAARLCPAGSRAVTGL
ncbi:hypothetical protein SAMN05216489_06553 [Streptomyces sp. 3213]|uniref:hypothetical protein n=1 Tax=Streptomyces sp. 3213.3 TaxID=1855348 RepID=UPI00089A31ED|nr:hypothetical protein [Streptomyces sp. 3213.3]SEE42152.1 hypothetical protein SAMN05216489_06553 [Streptomyces sp. 3213] [Streptomyces sp. 3213.3]